MTEAPYTNGLGKVIDQLGTLIQRVEEFQQGRADLIKRIDLLARSRTRTTIVLTAMIVSFVGAVVFGIIAINDNHQTAQHLQSVISCENARNTQSHDALERLFSGVLHIKSGKQLAEDIKTWEQVPPANTCR